MVQWHLEQKIEDSFSTARHQDEDRPAIGAPNKGKAEGKDILNVKNNSERRDCSRWTRKDQCSFGEACAFKHDPNKKGKGKGRPRSPSPSGSPHRNSKGDGQGSDDARDRGTVKLTDKSLSGKANRPPCTNFMKGSCQKEIHVIVDIVPKEQNSKLQVVADWETSVHANTQQHVLMQRNFQHRFFFTFLLWMNDRCQDPISSGLHHLANKCVLRTEKLRPTLGVIQTGFQNQRNAKSPTFEDRSLEWTLSMEEEVRKAAWIFTKERVQSSSFVFWEST